MFRTILTPLLAGALTAFAMPVAPAVADSTLVGHWTFNDASGGEQTGNWSSFGLRGNATISNGQLDVNGTGNGDNAVTGWARADGYTGPAIVDKTLIARVALDDLTPSGSPLGLDKFGGTFDSIVYAELQASRWMAGSNGFSRTQNFSPGKDDSSTGNMRQVVISYEGLGGGRQRITGCLDGFLLGSYEANNTATFASADSPTALFGPRHFVGSSATRGSINAHIDAAWLYNRAISCGDAGDPDGDGALNASDADDDGDGAPDADDAFPRDANESVDTDGDRTGNNADGDDDGDGVSDADDAFPLNKDEHVDTDRDGAGDNADTDDDGDGVPDTSDAFRTDPNESVDTDGDGVGNNADADDDADGIADADDRFPLDPAESADSDGDGVANNADPDDDNDGVADEEDAFPTNAEESIDTDGDGVGNKADGDDDGDGVPDSKDAFPLDDGEHVDTDGDGKGDNTDSDDDGDGVRDSKDAFRTDPGESIDTDGDGKGNNADRDDDGDGISDKDEKNRARGLSAPLESSVVVRGGAVDVGCALERGRLDRCVVVAYMTGGAGTSARRRIGSGMVRGGRARRVTVKVRLNEAGRRALAQNPGGIRVRFEVTARATDGRTLETTERATLRSERAAIVPDFSQFGGYDATLTPFVRKYLRRVAELIGSAKRVTCQGHTARVTRNQGAYRHWLGLVRARAVCGFLRQVGVAARFVAESFGGTRPRASNRTRRGRALNRRVELQIWR